MNELNELKLHPSFWTLHKKFWNEEFNKLNKDTGAKVINNPYCIEAREIEKKVISKIRQSLLTRA